MHCIYVRHGITQYSIENRFAGRCDIPIIGVDEHHLSDAFTLVKRFNPTILIHSPLFRAIQTAAYFESQFSFEKIICEPLLIERDFGKLEGMVKTEQNRQLLEQEPTAESLDTFVARVKELLTKYEGSSHNLLVVGHSAFFRHLSLLKSLKQNHLACCEAYQFTL